MWTFCLWFGTRCRSTFIDLYEFANARNNLATFHRSDVIDTTFSSELEPSSNIYLVDCIDALLVDQKPIAFSVLVCVWSQQSISTRQKIQQRACCVRCAGHWCRIITKALWPISSLSWIIAEQKQSRRSHHSKYPWRTVNDVLFWPKGKHGCYFRSTIFSRPVPSVFSFFEWKKNVVKTPYFIYQTEPLINEKHYPDVNVDKILQTIEKDKLPLLAMAGLFDVNRHCEVINEHEELFRTYSFSFSSLSKDRSLVFMHDLYSRCQWNDAKCTYSNASKSISTCQWWF